MRLLNWQPKLYTASCCVLAVAIPLPFIYSAIGAAMVVATGLFTGATGYIARAVCRRRVLWPWALSFALYTLSYFWSDNKAQALFDVGGKLSLLLLPLAMGAAPGLDTRSESHVLASFVAGVCGIALFCYIQAFFQWRESGNREVFFYHKLVRGLEANAVYMSWYTVTALTAVLLPTGVHRALQRRTWLFALVVLHLGVFLVLLSSKALLVLFLCGPVPVALYRAVRHSRPGRVVSLAVGVALAAGTWLVLHSSNPIHDRFSNVSVTAAIATLAPDYKAREAELDNLSIRTFVWRAGLDQVRRHNLWWTGCGAGDVQTVTDARMYELGIRNMYEPDAVRSKLRGLNLHNMYLQTLVMVGLAGVFLLIWMVGAPLAAAIRSGQLFWIFFAVIAVLFLVLEAAFQTQAGILFYTFFIHLFWNRWYSVKALHIKGAD